MDDRGFTLVEMLAALAVVALVMAGMIGAMQATSQLQRRTARLANRSEQASALGTALIDLLRDQGPFSSAGGVRLVGDQAGFSFVCGQARCAAIATRTGNRSAIRLSNAKGTKLILWPADQLPSFEYVGAKTRGDHWPPDNPTDWQPLQAIEVRAGDAPIAIAKLWIQGSEATYDGSLPGLANPRLTGASP